MCIFQVIGALSRTECKCHGVSTSCAVKTCWARSMPLSTVANMLKQAYDKALQVDELKNNYNTWRKPKRNAAKESSVDKLYTVENRKVRALDLVYIDHSPDFCDAGLYGPGTVNRECNPANGTCDILCCGRGHSAMVIEVTKRCRCVTHWCCEVKCERCTFKKTVYQCN